MSGKFVVIVIVLGALVFGAGLWYTQVYGYYYEVAPRPGQDVMLVAQGSGQPEPIAYADFRAIDADSSPIRFRACFTTPVDPAVLAAGFVAAPDKTPRVAPGWFDCFDADAIAAEIEAGTAATWLGAKNIAYGVDRIVAITAGGRGFVWHDLNDCGEKAYDGTQVGEDCPPRPQGAGQ